MTASPVDILMEEHRVIEKVIAAMQAFAERLEEGGAVDAETLARLAPFMREFADGCHHAKEEHRLFPALLAGGLPAENGPVQVMIAEHETGRALVGSLDLAASAYVRGEEGASAALALVLRRIGDLYSRHIWKEDNVLFPMADRVLSEEAKSHLMAEFEAVEAEHGPEVHERSARFAEEAASRASAS
jgi:hemerythrin-like domain-containing protein